MKKRPTLAVKVVRYPSMKRSMMALVDAKTGKPLPRQRSCSVRTHCNEATEVTVTFVVDGTDIVLEGNEVE